MKKTTCLLLILFCFFKVFSQINYYVDGTSGNDINNGTSINSAWQTIQKACNTALPNSVVHIKAGTYYENIEVNISGTAGNPITFKNYNNDNVFIDGSTTSGFTLLKISNKNYLNFQNLTFQNLTAPDAQGILVEATGTTTSTNLTFKNISIKNINWTANPSTLPTSNDNAQAFIVYGEEGGITNLIIDSCHVYDNILGYSEAISIDGNINGFVIKNCEVHDNTNIGIVLAGNYGVSNNPATDNARNGIVSNNECYRNISLVAASGGIYADGGKNITIEKNRCYENGYGIEVGCEENGLTDSITVKNNLIYNNSETGVYIGGYTTSTTGQVLHSIVRNNIFFQNNSSNSGSGELAMSKASHCLVENNIFYTNSQNTFLYVDAILPQTNNSFNYNCWYTPSNNENAITVNWGTSSYSTFSDYKTGTSQESNSIYTNPALSSPMLPTPDFHPLSSSLCIDVGNPSTNIGLGETDYDGNARISGSTIDLGPFETLNISNGLQNNEITVQSDVIVFPNPFVTKSTIFTGKELNNATICIYDIYGNKRSHQNCIYGQQINLERNNMTSGIYFIEIIEKKGLVWSGKIVVD